MTNKRNFKRLFFDIETSPNIGFFWQPGHKVSIGYDNIIQERAIICICYKWEHDNKVNYLSWNKGDDKELLVRFAKIMNQADEIIGHNSDQFDIKWVRARCIFHRIPLIPDFQTVDTLKLSRKGFRFNSHRLDYIAKFLGIGRKSETGGFNLWRDIVLFNSKQAMDKMINYCKNDVLLLQDVYEALTPYIIVKTHVGLHEGKDICSCPNCASSKTISNGTRITAGGTIKRRLHCQSCGQYFSVLNSAYEKLRD